MKLKGTASKNQVAMLNANAQSSWEKCRKFGTRCRIGLNVGQARQKNAIRGITAPDGCRERGPSVTRPGASKIPRTAISLQEQEHRKPPSERPKEAIFLSTPPHSPIAQPGLHSPRGLLLSPSPPDSLLLCG